jgi:hypothetical protein
MPATTSRRKRDGRFIRIRIAREGVIAGFIRATEKARRKQFVRRRMD